MTTAKSNVTVTDLRLALQKRLDEMAKTGLFEVEVDKDVLWNMYLDSFPAGTNELYKERREYDCNCCKQFIRAVGNVVTINSKNQLETIWDIKIGGYYQPVVEALNQYVGSKPIKDKFFHFERNAGTPKSVVLLEEGKTQRWDHLSVSIPQGYFLPNSQIATRLNDFRGNKDVLLRSLQELSLDSAEVVLELIAQNSLYRGDEHKRTVQTFAKLKGEFQKLSEEEQDNFAWKKSIELGAAGKFRNTAIGTLLIDLSSGLELEDAVRKFESVVAPSNYKRPTALVTKAMIEKAQATVEELGLVDSLQRRYAVVEDVSINNVLFADRSARKAMNAFDDLKAEVKTPAKNFDKVEEISADDFIKNVLPKANSLEVMVETRHNNNFMSLIAPKYKDAPSLFKWDNGFSWSYNGEVTDSIKERVKAAGGNVTGDLRVSLSWYNPDDLDLHVTEPGGNVICFSNKVNRNTGGNLDVDMNAYGKSDAHNPVENVTWPSESKMKEGVYSVKVNNYNLRLRDRVGFEVELEYKGQVFNFVYPNAVGNNKDVQVVQFKYSRAKGIEIIESIGHTKQSKDMWGVKTENFQKVNLVMLSPNHWDDLSIGNKHLFFVLEGCENPDATRGFYNEFLKEELTPHRKVFELLSGKMKAENSSPQLSGIGFSSTQRNSVLVRVSGAFNRTLKVVF